MAKKQSVHVVTTESRRKGKVYHAHLLRRSFREGGKVKKETVANLTPLGDELVELLRGGGRPLTTSHVTPRIRPSNEGPLCGSAGASPSQKRTTLFAGSIPVRVPV